MGLFDKIFSLFRGAPSPVKPSLVPPPTSNSSSGSSRTPAAGAGKGVSDVAGIKIIATGGYMDIPVTDEEIAEALKRYSFVFESDQRLKPKKSWWDMNKHERRLSSGSDSAYQWLEPFIPAKYIKEEAIRKAAERGIHGLKSLPVALRALIREKRKAKVPHDDLLLALYRICLLAEFVPSMQYEYVYPAELAEYVALEEWAQRMPDFASTGYQYFLTFNKSDVKWLCEAFGEPAAHKEVEELWAHVRNNAFSRYCWTEALSHVGDERPEEEKLQAVRQIACRRIETRIRINKDNAMRREATESRRQREREAINSMDFAWAAAAGEHVVADIETTGLSPDLDELLEVGAVKVDATGKAVAEFSALVRIPRPVPVNITKLTGITQADVDREGRNVADVLDEFAAFTSGLPLFFHNAPFDVMFLTKAAAENKRVLTNPVFDTLELARAAWPYMKSHKLAILAEELGLPIPGHRALADAKATMAVLRGARNAAGKAEMKKRETGTLV